MVLITTVAHSNGHTINFDEPIFQPSRVKLISASFYNSWNVLKSVAEITITDEDSKKQTGINIPPGHYTLKSMANKLIKLFNKNDIDLSIETNTSRGEMVILNPNEYTIWLDQKLHELIDIDMNNVPDIVVKRFKNPRSLFIHCDIVDKQNNLLNGRRSTILAKIDVKGKPFEKIYYEMPQNLFCKATKSRHLNSITLSVVDENDTLIDFGQFPLEFVLEIT